MRLVLLLFLATGALCLNVRQKRQEDGDFWWLKKEETAEKTEPEVKINKPEDPKEGKSPLLSSRRCSLKPPRDYRQVKSTKK